MSTHLESDNTTYDLTAQVTVVTGGGRGLGRAFAQALARAGAVVVVTARTESQLNETVRLVENEGGTIRAFPVDVTDQPAMRRMLTSVESELGPVDILVNNAAVASPLGYDWEVDPDEWWRTLEINLRAPFLCTRMVLPSMMARRKGRIVNVTSVAAYVTMPYATAYCASKAALNHLTRSLAESVKEYGIAVFSFAPGGPTAMIELVATSPNVSTQINDEFRGYLDGDGEIDQSTDMLMFLVSGQADALTGRLFKWDDSTNELRRRIPDIVQNDFYFLHRFEHN